MTFIPSLERLAKGIKEQGAKAILQIFHGGIQCPPELVDGDVVSASDITGEKGEKKPAVYLKVKSKKSSKHSVKQHAVPLKPDTTESKSTVRTDTFFTSSSLR